VIVLWLFLYLACLIQEAGLYTLEAKSPTTVLLLLPLLLLPLVARLRRKCPGAFEGWPLRAAGTLALVLSLLLARSLNLDFWDTNRWPPAIMAGLLGLALQWVILALPEECDGPGLWIWVAFWEYAGGWHPALTVLGVGLAVCLTAFHAFPRQPAPEPSARPMNPWPALILLGFVLPKPTWDHMLNPTWSRAFAAFAFGAALTHARWMRRIGSRIPGWALLAITGSLGFLYVSALAWLWALLLGAIAGWIWERLPRPLPMMSLTWAFLLGLVLSFMLHSNSGRPILHHLLWTVH